MEYLHAAFMYLRNGLADRVQIQCAVKYCLASSFPQVVPSYIGEVNVHVRTSIDHKQIDLLCDSRSEVVRNVRSALYCDSLASCIYLFLMS